MIVNKDKNSSSRLAITSAIMGAGAGGTLAYIAQKNVLDIINKTPPKDLLELSSKNFEQMKKLDVSVLKNIIETGKANKWHIALKAGEGSLILLGATGLLSLLFKQNKN